MSIIQIQWSLDNTIFKSADVLVKLFQAARDDDVQSAAIMVDEAKSALDNVGRFEVLQNVLVTIGVASGGVAYFVRKTATQCPPAFALATSLKAFLGDEEIGNVLYEMLLCRGLHKKPELRCSRSQLGKVIASLSGYTDNIIPNATVQTLIAALRSSSDPSPAWMKDALAPLSPNALAKIYSAVYAALQKDEVDLVTLTGVSGCIVVASSLLWLQEDDAQLVVDGELLIPSRATPKISIQLLTKGSRAQSSWVIQEWREAAAISNLVVEDEDSPSRSPQLPSFAPAMTAKEILAAQYVLSGTQTAQVGMIATALALVATERGLVTVGPTTPGQIPREVKLQDFCQSSYLSRVAECVTCYGWDKSELDGAADLADEIKQWTEQGFPDLELDKIKPPHPLTQKPIDCITWVVEFTTNRWYRKSGAADSPIARGVAEAAIYLAAESLYTSVCSRFPQKRFYRIGTFGSIAHNGAAMMHWILRHEGLRGRTDIPPPIFKLVSYVVDTFTLRHLRCDCMGSLLPGSNSAEYIAEYTGSASDTVVHRRDLAFAMNGYVAWLPQLRAVSTLPRQVSAVEVCAGYMRYDPLEGGQDPNNLLRIQSDEPSAAYVDYTQGDGPPPDASRLSPFDTQGTYIGLGPFPDTEGLQVKHYWNQVGRVLNLRTGILHPATGRICAADWIASVEALAGATHLTNLHLPSFAEKAMAESWKTENIWQTIFLVSIPNIGLPKALNGAPTRCIARTRGSEELRFFLAGAFSMHRLFVCHGDVSIATPFAELLKGPLAKAKKRLVEEKKAEERAAKRWHKDTADENEGPKDAVYRKRDEETIVNWLINDPKVGQHMKDLYSTLSQIIHEFSDGKPTADSLKQSFSPDDARLLIALLPDKSQGEDMDWNREFVKYIWSVPNTADRAGAAGTVQLEVEKGTQDEAALDRVNRSGRIEFRYTPAIAHINSDGLLHRFALATLVGSAGHMALAASGPPGRHLTGRRSDVSFENHNAAKHGDELKAVAKPYQDGRNKQPWFASVDIETVSGGIQIANGRLKAWEVQQDEEKA
ncbi:hypothetical protein ACJ41O_000718 [Fusarium nematophilum]